MFCCHGRHGSAERSPQNVSPLHWCRFCFTDWAPTEIYTLSLHDALPIFVTRPSGDATSTAIFDRIPGRKVRSEEHTSELQSRLHLVCRLLLEKKKIKK